MPKFQSILLILLFAVFSSIGFAQSTIFNIPSTDVIAPKTFFVETDFISHFAKLKNGGFQTYGYRTVYGVKRKLETGFNVFYTRNSGNAPIEFQPNLKWKAYENEKRGVAVTAGTQFFVPLNRAAGTRTYGMFYANASKVVQRARGLRLTAGGYQMVGTSRIFGSKRGVILGIEQPIKWKFSFVADWYSGNNRFGYATAGFNYALTKKQFLMMGYNWGNSGRGNNAFSAFYGFTY